MQEAVYSQLADKSLFVRTSRTEMIESLRLDVCHGIFDAQGRLCAYGHCVINRDTDRNLGLLDDMLPAQCLTLDTVFVDPAARGHGYQRLLIHSLLDACAHLRAAYVYATIAPGNLYSLRNAEAEGFAARRSITCYGGLQRLLLRKALQPEASASPERSHHA